MSRAQAVAEMGNLHAFHQDQHRFWRRVAGWLAVSNAVMAGALFGYIWIHSTTYITVAATAEGRVIPLTSLDEPIMSDSALKNWTVAAVTQAFTLGHHDWRERLSAVREHFTDDGYESFMAGLEESLLLARLRDNRQVASAVATGAPVVVDTLRFDGRIGWEIQFPMLVTFQAGAKRLDQPLRVSAVVIRVPLSDRQRGIGIARLVASRGKGAG